MISSRRIPIYSSPLFWSLLVFWSTVATPTLAKDVDASTTKDTLLGRAFEMIGLLLHRCLDDATGTEDTLLSVHGCLKRRSLLALDRMLTIDHMRIYDGVALVRKQNETVRDSSEIKKSSTYNGNSWISRATAKLGKLFETHNIELQFKPNAIIAEARRRHHQHMMPLVMFGTLAISMIAIPLGFQFLAVLGGKALLLAKLALILTSIQGLKKIATSNLNYGLYQAPHASPCKETPLNCIFPDDNSFDITLANQDFLFHYYFDDFPLFLGHGYDRRWNYDLKEDPSYKHGSYDQPDAVLDMLHPLSPRSTSGYEPT